MAHFGYPASLFKLCTILYLGEGGGSLFILKSDQNLLFSISRNFHIKEILRIQKIVEQKIWDNK